MGYVSPRARFLGKIILSDSAIVYGSTAIGGNSIIGDYVVLGFPRRRVLKSLRNAFSTMKNVYEQYDSISSGVIIGENVVIRPFTVVYEGSRIGDNVETGHFVLIREEVEVGEGSLIGTNTIVDGYVRIGRNVRIESGVYIPPKTIIEDNVFLGPHATITNDKYPVSKRLVGVTIRRGAVIGANSTLIAGVEIGEEAVVAAGSVVTRNVPPRTVVAGVPAKPIASRKEYDEKKKAYENIES